MLAEPEISRTGSVGSFFLNPEVGAETAREIASRLARPGQAMPRWELPGGGVKLSAAWLVEQSGLPRGWRRGRVGLSPHHALAIVNLGGASAAEIVELARTVQDRVLAACGLWLQPEPVLLGFGSGEGLTPTPPAGSSPGRVP
jgi:UDP-N-acetylmuramate dehydrogenase